MTLRPPQAFDIVRRESALDYEIVQEQAAALSRMGRALEQALAALSRHDLTHISRPEGETVPGDRTQLVHAASHALWCFIVQREACGLRDQRLILREYRVPAEVRNRMGTFSPSGPNGR
jgi:hypothetical protein